MKTDRSPKETAQARKCAKSLKRCFTMYLDVESNSGVIFKQVYKPHLHCW